MWRMCLNCGASTGMTHFEGEAFAIEHAGMSAIVEGHSGWRCQACDEVEFDPGSALRYAAAGDASVLRGRGSKPVLDSLHQSKDRP
jgi:HTH-type transcriptional regulator/antitoxin MqsA